MTDADDAAAPALGTTRSSAKRNAWVLFAPPAVLLGLRWVLAWQQERSAEAVLLPLMPFVPAPDMWAVLQPALRVLLAGLMVLVLILLARRRMGTRRVLRVLAVAWVALALAVAAGMLRRDLNVRGAQPLPPVPAQVIGSRAQAPSTRGPGGTLLVLRVHSLAQPQQVLVDDPQAAHWRPGQRLVLAWARGRYQGLFVTGWRALSAPAPAQVQASAQVPARNGDGPFLQGAVLSSAGALPTSTTSTAFNEADSTQPSLLR